MKVPVLAATLLPWFCQLPHMDRFSCPADRVDAALVVTLLAIRRYLRRPGMYRSTVTFPLTGFDDADVMGATLAVAADDDFKVRYPPVLICPFDTVNTSVRFKVPASVPPAILFIVSPLIVFPEKAEAGIICGEVPFNSMLPLVAIRLPVVLMEPPIFKVAPVTVKDPPLKMVMFLIATVPEPIFG